MPQPGVENARLERRPPAGRPAGRRLKRALLGAAALFAALAPLGLRPPAAAADSGGSCAWFGKLSTAGVNALSLDSNVTYWVTRIPYVPGEKLQLKGAYPHSRYFSVTAYDPRTKALSSLYDAQVQPDPGSVNPFTPGAPRNLPDQKRAYSLSVVFLAPGQSPSAAPNTLSTGWLGGPTAAGSDYFLVYRVYLPDQGAGAQGGEPLPAVSLVPPLGPPTALPDCPAQYDPPSTVGDELAGASQPATLPAGPGLNPPAWHKFYNLGTSIAQLSESPAVNFSGQVTPYTMKTGQGGYLEDLENAYLYTLLNANFGPLAVIHAQALGFSNTYPAAGVMPPPADTRYWSFCSYDPATTRNYGCAADFQAAGSGSFTVVVSTPANKPADLCGAAWVPYGPGTHSLLIFRNQLGTAPYTIQGVQAGHEADMGGYYPSTAYMDQNGYAQSVCGQQAAGPDAGGADLGGFADATLGADFSAAGADYGGLSLADGSADGGVDAASTDAPPDASADAPAVIQAQRVGALRGGLPPGNQPLGAALGLLTVGSLALAIRRKLAAD